MEDVGVPGKLTWTGATSLIQFVCMPRWGNAENASKGVVCLCTVVLSVVALCACTCIAIQGRDMMDMAMLCAALEDGPACLCDLCFVEVCVLSCGRSTKCKTFR